jgi:hypothetical protein
VSQGKIIDIKEDNILGSFKTLIGILVKDQPIQIRDIVKDAVMRSNWNLPVFEIEDEEELAEPEFLIDEDDDE